MPAKTLTSKLNSFTKDNLVTTTIFSQSESELTGAKTLHNFLRTRRSIRNFESGVIPNEIIRRVIETASYAPSAHNRQPWRFAVITDSKVKLELAQAMGNRFRLDLAGDKNPAAEIEARITLSRERILSAPVVIILCLDPSEMDDYPDEKRKKAEFMMAVQSVAAAGQTLLLALHAEGLSAVWTCGPLFAPDVVVNALHLPILWEPQAMFFIGRSTVPTKPKSVLSLEKISIWF